MDFRLKVFQKTAERLSFTKAAKDLHVTQPAVTKHVRELERHFGHALFSRHGNSISLTSEGQILYRHTLKILDAYSDLEEDFLALNNKFPKEIIIGASTTISQYVLPKVLSKFRSIYPETTVTLLNANSENVESLLVEKKIAIGFIEGITANPLLHYETFIQDEIVLVTREDNPTMKKETISVTELKKLPLIYREEGSGTRDIIDRYLQGVNLSSSDMNIEMVFGSSESIKSYLANSNTFAFLSIHSIIDELKSGVFRVVDVKGLELKRTFEFVNLHGEYSNTTQKIKHFFETHYNLME